MSNFMTKEGITEMNNKKRIRGDKIKKSSRMAKLFQKRIQENLHKSLENKL